MKLIKHRYALIPTGEKRWIVRARTYLLGVLVSQQWVYCFKHVVNHRDGRVYPLWVHGRDNASPYATSPARLAADIQNAIWHQAFMCLREVREHNDVFLDDPKRDIVNIPPWPKENV